MSNPQVDYATNGETFSLSVVPRGSGRDVPIVYVYPSSETKPVQLTQLSEQIIDVTVSYSISAATAVTFSVIDPGLQLTLQNYFQPGQTIIYRSHNTFSAPGAETLVSNAASWASNSYVGYFMEIADVTIEQSQGNSPVVRVQCYTKAIQQMKRDRNPGVVKGTGTDFVQNAAKKYGLKCVAQKTSATRQITQADGDNVADSLWNVLEKLAGESKDENKNPFVIFESDGTLFFGSQQWLMYSWGHDSYIHKKFNAKNQTYSDITRRLTYLHYPPRIVSGKADNRFILHGLPSMHKSENDPMEGDGSCIVDRTNGVRLRPGMTVNVGSIPWFTDDFLITGVDFEELSPSPVNIKFATPPRQEKKIKQIEVGKIYPGSVSWSEVEGLISVQRTSTFESKAP
jgi:hypothetical protein